MCVAVVSALLVLLCARCHASHVVFTSTSQPVTADASTIHISVVACGADRVEETMVMFKSACLLTHAPLHFHVFGDDEVRPIFQKQLESWPAEFRARYEYSLYRITYPPGEIDWKNVFKPCATQRLFIPYLVDPGLERLLYVDTDILFLRPVDDLWAFFSRFNETQMAALSPEHEQPWQGWYNRFARHPYYGEMGVNSGVMLMSPVRMRAGQWEERMIEYYKIYRYNMTWGDQDLINIYFSAYPERLFVFGCEWNYRADHCMYGSNCGVAEQQGASVLHGNRGYYHNDKQPAFRAVYQALRDYEFGAPLGPGLMAPLRAALERDAAHTYCGKVAHILYKQLENQTREERRAREEAKQHEQEEGEQEGRRRVQEENKGIEQQDHMQQKLRPDDEF